MSKQSGLGDNLYVAGYNLSGDIGELGKVGGGVAPIEVTGIDKSAYERIGGIRDGGIDFKAFFNPGPALDAAHLRLSLLPTADQIVTYARGTNLGDPAACLVSKQLNYDPKRAQGGEFTFEISAAANGYGLEWGKQLTPGRKTDGVAGNGTGVDMGLGSGPGFTGPALFGLQAYLHVFAVTGTSVTVKLQESSDNGVGDAWTDVVGGGFTAATGVTSQRIETARGQTVEQYLRAVSVGTFTNAIYAVVVARNDIATVF